MALQKTANHHQEVGYNLGDMKLIPREEFGYVLYVDYISSSLGYTVFYEQETVISTILSCESTLNLFLLSVTNYLPYYELISGDIM